MPAIAGPPKLVGSRGPGGAIRRKLVLGGDPLGNAGPIVQRMRSARGEARRPPLAIAHRLGLDPELAEGGEVGHQVGCVEQPLAYVYELACHGRGSYGWPRTEPSHLQGNL